MTADFEAHRSYLLRVALLQMNDPDIADDLVQETMAAAVEGWSSFSGKSSVRTWLTGILKHKIIDAIRRKSREPNFTSLTAGLEDELETDDFIALFNNHEHWEDRQPAWANPDEALERAQFRDILDFCLQKLPKNTARVFMMREVLECSNEEICKELSITSTNAWVLLYRARMALRLCLQKNWFGTPPDTVAEPTR